MLTPDIVVLVLVLSVSVTESVGMSSLPLVSMAGVRPDSWLSVVSAMLGDNCSKFDSSAWSQSTLPWEVTEYEGLHSCGLGSTSLAELSTFVMDRVGTSKGNQLK